MSYKDADKLFDKLKQKQRENCLQMVIKSLNVPSILCLDRFLYIGLTVAFFTVLEKGVFNTTVYI